MSPAIFRTRQSGFSLIEVLVTMVIVSIGLMGLISLVTKGLQANASSSLRSIATTQAYDLADRMRGNTPAVTDGGYDESVPPGSGASCPITDTVPAATSAGLATACSECTSSSCSASDISTRDLCIWHKSNAALLPSGSGAVCKDASGDAFTIHVSWDDNRSGDPNKTFILKVEP